MKNTKNKKVFAFLIVLVVVIIVIVLLLRGCQDSDKVDELPIETSIPVETSVPEESAYLVDILDLYDLLERADICSKQWLLDAKQMVMKLENRSEEVQNSDLANKDEVSDKLTEIATNLETFIAKQTIDSVDQLEQSMEEFNELIKEKASE